MNLLVGLSPGRRLPISLPAMARLIWYRTLFPGLSAPAERPRLLALLLLVVLPGLLLYPGLGFHLFEPDEGRYAEIPREMLAHGDWVVPTLQGEPYLDKPPLLYWCVMASYQLFGAHDWSARIVPALAVHLTLLFTYGMGARLLGERPAFWGTLLLALAPGFVTVGRLLILDGLLTLWTTVAWLAQYEAVRHGRLRWGWWLLAAIATGLGILTKGPVIVVLTVPPLIGYRWLMGGPIRLRASLMELRWPLTAAVGVVLGLTVPWYAMISWRLPEFPAVFFWQHNVVRFLAPFDHQQPIWYYGPVLAFGLLPGSLLLPALLRSLVGNQGGQAERRGPEVGFLLLAAAWCVLFFSLSGCKLPTYVLPAYPPLALALGAFMTARDWTGRWWLRGGLAVAFVGLLLVHHLALPWFARFHSPMGRADVVARYCGPSVPVACHPRSCDSVAFYLGRDDFRTFRGKETAELIAFCRRSPKTVVLFTHRHSLRAFREVLPRGLAMTEEVPLFDSVPATTQGLTQLVRSSVWDGSRDGSASQCFMAVVRR